MHAHAYAAVRGMPKRLAGEDFHMLGKLAKIGPVWRHGPVLTLRPRASTRVPFGTGPATRRMASEGVQTLAFYPPQSFEVLAELLQYAQGASQRLSTDAARVADVVQINARRARAGGRSGARVVHEWFDATLTLRIVREVQRALPRRSWLDMAKHWNLDPTADAPALAKINAALRSQEPPSAGLAGARERSVHRRQGR